MQLEFMEELSASSDQIILKGKRAKRRRPSSSASSTGCGGDFYNFPISSPTTSSTTTEEDEDMAHCLILLARGSSPSKSEKITAAAVAGAAAGKVGVYVYECKTCNRAFPSFQALGGHRASHKRPKTAADDDRKKIPPPPDNKGDEEGHFRPTHLTNSVIETERVCYNEQGKHKIHECSICGSEFGSGQALGGHMRRHRVAAAKMTSSHEVCEKPRNILALDLNLPAPPEDQFPVVSPPRRWWIARIRIIGG